MKKIIVLFIAVLCVALGASAGDKVDVTHTEYGQGVDLVTTTYFNGGKSSVLYGLRKNGIVLVQDCELMVEENLRVFIFFNEKYAAVYRVRDGKELAKVEAQDQRCDRFDKRSMMVVTSFKGSYVYKTVKFCCTPRKGDTSLGYREIELGTFCRTYGRLFLIEGEKATEL